MKRLPKYSLGIGDRFGRQGPAQLDALIRAEGEGVLVAPVWNKSHREHAIVGSRPADVRREADDAVRTRGWIGPYFVDADHINLRTVEAFLASSDFFTLDVADAIGREPAAGDLEGFLARHRRYLGTLGVPGIEEPLEIREQTIARAGRKFLAAVQEAGAIYRRIAEARDPATLVIEVSMDETDTPQTPADLLFILAAIAEQKIPAATIAPRFTGRFNKGVDYVGQVGQFRREFEQDLAVIAFATGEFGLPADLKLSVHSGSDKFSIYGPMKRALRRFDAGIHLKTAGTTWLEEVIGLALAGGDGLRIAKDIYAQAVRRIDELCAPYASVVDIDPGNLPPGELVEGWDGEAFAAALRHDPRSAAYNADLRQLLHVSYRLAAEMGSRFLAALERHGDVIAQGVTENLFDRHIRPLFLE